MSEEFGPAVSTAPLYVNTPYSIHKIIGLIWDNDGNFIEKVWCIIKNEYDAGRRKRECEISLEMAFQANKDKVLDYIWECKVPKVYWQCTWNAVFDEEQPDL